jgi:hypothetical protein
MKTESIPPALRNLLTKLEYISMIERGQKPCFSDMTFVQSNSWIGAWKRLITGENKKNLLFEVEQIIDRTILAIEEYSNKEYIKLLLENLAKAKIGIENLILTYTEHPETISNLRVYIINIDLTLKKHGVSINPYEITVNKFSGLGDPNLLTSKANHITKNESSKNQSEIQNIELLKIIDTFNASSRSHVKSTPLPIGPIQSGDLKQKIKQESFKRFTPKDYIEKHMFSPSSPDQSLTQLSSPNDSHTDLLSEESVPSYDKKNNINDSIEKSSI